MKNETLLKKLQKIEKNGSINLDPDFIALLNEVKQDVYNEANSFTTDQKRAAKKALNFLKAIQKKDTRPVLGCCDFQEYNGSKYQFITDSYILIGLKTFYELPTVDDLKKSDPRLAEATYPQVVRIIPNKNDGLKVETDLSEYLKKLKAGMYEKEKLDCLKCGSYDVWFNVENLKKIIEMLGTDRLDIYVYGVLKPILLIDPKNENIGLLTPIRKYE